MAEKMNHPGDNYDYPLIIKKLLKDPLIKSPDREIVYGDSHRYTYRDLSQRIAKLASGLTELGAAPGDTIAVFDYDSHRYLEFFFAIPMIGAVLQTVNWRLSAEQISYTVNHAEAQMIIIKTGKPIPMAEIEVVDADGNILPHDGVSTGEVVMRSPWLTQGYFKAADKSKELWRNGWLHSGDVGYISEDGYLQITDRIKDVIKSGGEWVSSLDLENLLSQHEAVLESAAIGMPDEKWGERPLMIVTLKPEYQGKVGEEELKAFMKKGSEEGKLPKYGVPDRYVFTDAIPKTSVGELDKKVLRKQYV